MELRFILFFCLCILVIIFGNSSGQTQTDGNIGTVYTTTKASNEGNTDTMTTRVRISATTEPSVSLVTTVASTTGSTKSSSVASTEKKKVTSEKSTTDSTPPDKESMVTTILSITTAAGFLLWIFTLLILCFACCYKRCGLCKDKGSTRSVAPPGPPPTSHAPEPAPRVSPLTHEEDLYVMHTKKPNWRKQPNHRFLEQGHDPMYDVSPQHHFTNRMQDYEDDISEANTDGISDCGEVFIDDENRHEVNMSSERLQEKSTSEVASTFPDITQSNTSHISPTSRLSHTHTNPLFLKQLKETASLKAPERLEDAGFYSDVTVEDNVM